ncbi:RabGAP/TBC [Gautieria morchelliformis]|nr:RabGAP/TBC [Gautieria morchelliformis]
MADYHQFARENSDELARAIESGIPSSLRGMMWQLMSASKDPELEAEYARLLKESSIHEKAIMRDLGRTFPHHDFFMDGQGIGQENLFNVLKAYSLYDPDVGYCQGLPFIVAILLLNMPDEEAFCLLVRLMATYGLRSHFLPEMPGLQLRLFQFDRLAEELLPVLHIHFLRQGVKSSMFCSQWFLTMFSYRFPLDVVFRIFDNVLATGIEAIFGFSLALLQKNEESLLTLKFDDILGFLRNKLFDSYKVESEQDDPVYLVDVFVRDASLVRITPFMLDAYAREYQDAVREREAHAVEMDSLRNANRHLTAQVKSLEDSLAQLNTEHCDIVKQLVMARLENEETEGELVRYKLLYADLMHKSEDAGSSHRLSNLRVGK